MKATLPFHTEDSYMNAVTEAMQNLYSAHLYTLTTLTLFTHL